jgi:hypothetical protein
VDCDAKVHAQRTKAAVAAGISLSLGLIKSRRGSFKEENYFLLKDWDGVLWYSCVYNLVECKSVKVIDIDTCSRGDFALSEQFFHPIERPQYGHDAILERHFLIGNRFFSPMNMMCPAEA